jgi:murein DD-endopeptidase MepM/ murein hydrolase activator NlpD
VQIPILGTWRTSRLLIWGYILASAAVIVLGVRLYVVHRALARSEVQLFAAKQEIARLRLLEQAVSKLESRHRELVMMLQQTEVDDEPGGGTDHTSGAFLRDHELIMLPKESEKEWVVDLDPSNQEPHLWPTVGWVSQEFRAPTNETGSPHYGVDIAGRLGTPIVAPANGVVMQVYWDKVLGRVLEIQHGSGHLTRYGHLQRVEVQPGEAVEVGQIVARLGDSGESSAPHLHYEVELLDEMLNPASFLPDYGSLLSRVSHDSLSSP